MRFCLQPVCNLPRLPCWSYLSENWFWITMVQTVSNKKCKENDMWNAHFTSNTVLDKIKQKEANTQPFRYAHHPHLFISKLSVKKKYIYIYIHPQQVCSIGCQLRQNLVCMRNTIHKNENYVTYNYMYIFTSGFSIIHVLQKYVDNRNSLFYKMQFTT